MTTGATALDLIVNRADLSEAEIVAAGPAPAPGPGECLLRIDRFALTANNITYGVAGDSLDYWNFFPCARAGWGRIPVWGFAEVIASAHPDVAEGARVYGYLPMSSHVSVAPGKVTPHGFVDLSAHRQPMAPIYNHYARTDADPAYAPDREGLISLFRPLFTTSFLLDDFHRRNDAFGADTILLTSASSKTAIGLAWLLAQGEGVRVAGLTSAANRAFVEGLGVYDHVVTYVAPDSALPAGRVALVDMAGNAEVLRRLHAHYGDAMTNSCRVGLTHWQDTASGPQKLPGPRPAFFFAPSYAEERIAAWGREGFGARLGDAWAGFTAAARGWLREVEAIGPEPVLAVYRAMQSGRIDPAEGHILSLTGQGT